MDSGKGKTELKGPIVLLDPGETKRKSGDSVVPKVWCPDEQIVRCRVSSCSTLGQNWQLRDGGPAACVFVSPPGDSDGRHGLRISALGISNPQVRASVVMLCAREQTHLPLRLLHGARTADRARVRILSCSG